MAVPLFHGPTAREEAVRWAEEQGRLLAEPFGDEGLDVDTSRGIVETLGSTPVGDQLGTVVVGPLDMDRVKSINAVEALLKTIEDLPAHILLISLWAEDVGGVLGTIRSRSEEHWCPALPDAAPEAPYLVAATSLCEAALQRRRAAVIEIFDDNKGSELDLLRAAATVLATKDDWPWKARLILWGSLREALQIRKPSARNVLAAFMV